MEYGWQALEQCAVLESKRRGERVRRLRKRVMGASRQVSARKVNAEPNNNDVSGGWRSAPSVPFKLGKWEGQAGREGNGHQMGTTMSTQAPSCPP